jgi:GntR family transcriptional regulator
MKRLADLYDRSRIPLYVQVASVMRQRIDNGIWGQGERISTLEELEVEFSVARVTIRQAIELLRDEGLLDAQQGRGTFVSGRPRHDRFLRLGTDLESTVALLSDNVPKRIHIVDDAPPPDLGEEEGKPADRYALLRSVQHRDGTPFSAVTLYLARSIYERDPERFTHRAALPMIVQMGDVQIAHAYQTLTIGVADPNTAEQLEIGLGEPVADCRLVLIDGNGVAIYVANIHYKKECFELRVDLLDRAKGGGREVERPPADTPSRSPTGTKRRARAAEPAA